MSDNKSSSVVALHNFMSKLHDSPKYELLQKFGKSHRPFFKYSCKAMGEEVIGTGRTKRGAKNIVAQLMLEQLARRGYRVPQEFQNPETMSDMMERAGLPTRSFVILLNEMCHQYHLDPVEYEIVAAATSTESNFTVTARIGYVQRIASAASKRMATQLAAEKEEAMVRAYERALSLTEEEAVAETARRRVLQDAAAGEAAGGQSEQEMEHAAIAAARRLEHQAMDHDGSVPSTSRLSQSEEDARNAAMAAMSFIEDTMERLGI